MAAQPNTIPNDDFNSILAQAVASNTASTVTPGVASKQEIANVINTIASIPGQSIKASDGSISLSNFHRACMAISELCLRGGTSPKFSETAMSSVANPIIISQKQFKEACTKNKTTTRKVARGLKEEALAVAKAFGIAGNLSKSYKLQKPDATFDELVYCNDFFTFSFETEMPESVRTFLIDNYNTRFRKRP